MSPTSSAVPASSRSARSCSSGEQGRDLEPGRGDDPRRRRPQQRGRRRADQRDLEHALAELHERAQREQAPGTGQRREPLGLGGQRLGADHAGRSGSCRRRARRRAAAAAASSSAMPSSPSSVASSRSSPIGASAKAWGRASSGRSASATSLATAGASSADQQRPGAQDQRVVDLARGRDLALAARLVEAPLASAPRSSGPGPARRPRLSRLRAAPARSRAARRTASSPAPSDSMMVAKAARICSGRAMKKTWKVGIRRLSTPIAR